MSSVGSSNRLSLNITIAVVVHILMVFNACVDSLASVSYILYTLEMPTSVMVIYQKYYLSLITAGFTPNYSVYNHMGSGTHPNLSCYFVSINTNLQELRTLNVSFVRLKKKTKFVSSRPRAFRFALKICAFHFFPTLKKKNP